MIFSNIHLETINKEKTLIEKDDALLVTVEAISKTPFALLTEAQKQKIKTEYRGDCDYFDSQEWHDNGDFLYDKIISGLASRFHKTFSKIETIIRS